MRKLFIGLLLLFPLIIAAQLTNVKPIKLVYDNMITYSYDKNAKDFSQLGDITKGKFTLILNYNGRNGVKMLLFNDNNPIYFRKAKVVKEYMDDGDKIIMLHAINENNNDVMIIYAPDALAVLVNDDGIIMYTEGNFKKIL